MEDWYWAAARSGPALDKFVIANGRDELWHRVRREIDANEHCAWNAVHRGSAKARLEDVLDLMLTVILPYRVHYNSFVLEAAKMPVFAGFLRNARSDLCNYVSNSADPDVALPMEPFDEKTMRRLGGIVNDTLGTPEDDWF